MHLAARMSFAGAFLFAALPAQCPFSSLSSQSVGPWCNTASTGFCAIASTPTTLTTVLDPASCSLTVDVVAFQGCGASIPLRALALGAQPAHVPLPEFGPMCELQVAPDVLLASAGVSFVLPLPAGALPPLTFYCQGFALSVPPFGADIATLSEGLEITLH